MELLREAGIPESNIMKLLQIFPRTLTRKPDQFKDVVEEVKEIGFDPLTFQFVMAVRVCLSLSKSTRANKVDVYRKRGWSHNDILTAFRKFPFAIVEFLVHKLGCESSTMKRYPTVFTRSLKRRIIPRGAVFQVLLSKGLMEKKSLVPAFGYPESYFLNKFVLCHEQEASVLLELYQSKLDLAS